MAGTKKQRGGGEEMSWISRKLFLYNVTIGLYAMDWWERYLFSILQIISQFLCVQFSRQVPLSDFALYWFPSYECSLSPPVISTGFFLFSGFQGGLAHIPRRIVLYKRQPLSPIEHHRFRVENSDFCWKQRNARALDSERFALPTTEGEMAGEMSWVGKKIHLYNVTMGLYMLDWWERCLFSILPLLLDRDSVSVRYLCEFHPCCAQNYRRLGFFLDPPDILVLILLWFVCFNASRFATDVFERYLNRDLYSCVFQ
ncbi:hypothetical protein BAE44_0013980 [Dichanthelium oligosanthes]|uniref:Uncharacterized protein n=1 Tax=Dichanthelium oligosanthes TaxID=888268 RepID=A0A1E5VIP9_9POAL|nr:hypothetical protein BAE44_0013980 [Dichanthelium oligosanthes]